MRSVTTDGTFCTIESGSREVGISASSSLLMLTPVLCLRLSMSGASAVTSTSSLRAETFMAMRSGTALPALTETEEAV